MKYLFLWVGLISGTIGAILTGLLTDEQLIQHSTLVILLWYSCLSSLGIAEVFHQLDNIRRVK